MKQKKFNRDIDLLSDQYDKFSYPNPINNIASIATMPYSTYLE